VLVGRGLDVTTGEQNVAIMGDR